MKYLITDTEEHTLGEINQYLYDELKQTNLNKDDIVIAKTLQDKIAMAEIERILDENEMSLLYESSVNSCNSITLKHTQHTLEFSENELASRFDDAYNCILTGLKEDMT